MTEADAVGLRRVRVVKKQALATDVVGLTLADVAGGPLPTWEPGAHVCLHLPNGISRDYSLCSDPLDDTTWTVAVARAPGSRGGSSYIHDVMAVDDVIAISEPVNNFPLGAESESVLIAGGIGITPVITMARHLERAGRQWTLYYAGRRRAAMALLDAVAELPRQRVYLHVDDDVGGFPEFGFLRDCARRRAVVYCCGPSALMSAVSDALPDRTLLRVEWFDPPVLRDGDSGRSGFDAVIRSTGERIHVGRDESLLRALVRAGHGVPFQCEEGICGTCRVRVSDGEVDHRDWVMSKEAHRQAGTLMACVSRAAGSTLVLDL